VSGPDRERRRRPRPTMKLRRLLALVLIVLGAVLLWLAPETPGGIILIVAGVAVEIVGILLERRF